MEDPVLLARDGAIATITLNRPAVLNALDPAMARALLAAVATIAAAEGIRCVVLTGAGRGFCAGGDLATFTGDDPAANIAPLIEDLHAAIEALAALPAPSIARIHGPAAGAGFSLAMACDLAIASEDARFTLAYARIGATPDGSSTWHLPRLVGLRRAKAIALLAEPMTAAEALDFGLVNRVVPAAELDAATAALAARLAAGPTLAYRRTRTLLEASLDASLPDQLAAERHAFLESCGTADFAAGVAAFRARREPVFEGR